MESWTKATLTFVGSWGKTALERRRTVTWNLAAVGRKVTAWKRQAKKTDPKRLTRPLDTNEYIAINYSTNTLKYIPHARRTNLQKSQRAKTKDTNKRVFSSLHKVRLEIKIGLFWIFSLGLVCAKKFRLLVLWSYAYFLKACTLDTRMKHLEENSIFYKDWRTSFSGNISLT